MRQRGLRVAASSESSASNACGTAGGGFVTVVSAYALGLPTFAFVDPGRVRS